MNWLPVIAVIAILIFFNALYVAAEFAMVNARRSRLAQMADQGNLAARLILPYLADVRHLDAYIAACQIGITISSLVLGFYGQANLAAAIAPFLARLGDLSVVAAQSAAAIAVLILLTSLQVVLGELVPKNIGIQYPEQLAVFTALPMRWSLLLFQPLIWFFNGSGQLVLRLAGVPAAAGHTHVHEPEEIRMLVEESSAGGLLQREERRLLENTLRLRELTVGEVMIPRVRMVAAPVDEPCSSLLASLANSTYSRMPLYAGSIDNIVGIVHLRDLLCLSTCAEPQSVRNVMRQVPFVVEAAPVEVVFLQLQEEQDHVAIVVDEFGGTAGMVTLEDLIEEIFGDLQDEFDQEPPAVQVWPDNRIVLRGDTSVEDANYWLDVDLPSAEADTIGGLVLSILGAMPTMGQEIEVNDLTFRVESMEGHAVGALSVVVEPRQAQRIQELAL